MANFRKHLKNYKQSGRMFGVAFITAEGKQRAKETDSLYKACNYLGLEWRQIPRNELGTAVAKYRPLMLALQQFPWGTREWLNVRRQWEAENGPIIWPTQAM